MPPPEDYDVVVLGSPMLFNPEATLIASYIEDHREALAQIPSALFTVSSSRGRFEITTPVAFFELPRDAPVAARRRSRLRRWRAVSAREGLMLRLAQGMGRQGIYQDRSAFQTDWGDVERFADTIAIEPRGAAITVERTQPH